MRHAASNEAGRGADASAAGATAPSAPRLAAWRRGGGGPSAIVLATALMAFQDALVKLMSAGLPLWQFFLLRSLIVLALLALPLWRGKGRERVFGRWALIRSGLIVAMYVFFYAGLPVLALPVVSAVYYTGPILIVLLSALILKERLTPARAGAVALAFAGVVMVLRPGGTAFSPAALIPLLAALAYALSAVVTRARLRAADPFSLTASLNVVFVAVGGCGVAATALIGRPDAYPFLLSSWAAVDAATAALLALLAVVSIAIHALLARAYQRGPTPVVAGLDYSYLGFAALWAILFFGTVPDMATIAGTILIAMAGLWGLTGGAKA